MGIDISRLWYLSNIGDCEIHQRTCLQVDTWYTFGARAECLLVEGNPFLLCKPLVIIERNHHTDLLFPGDLVTRWHALLHQQCGGWWGSWIDEGFKRPLWRKVALEPRSPRTCDLDPCFVSLDISLSETSALLVKMVYRPVSPFKNGHFGVYRVFEQIGAVQGLIMPFWTHWLARLQQRSFFDCS